MNVSVSVSVSKEGPITTITGKYKHTANIDTVINTTDLNIEYNVYVVYFINCLVKPTWFEWLTNQLKLVEHFGATIYIVATLLPENEESFRQMVAFLYPNDNIHIDCYYENEFEYRGILKVWELGQIYNRTNDIILYFHSKGVTHYDHYAECDYEINYINKILHDIDKIKEIYTIFPFVDKIGYFSGGTGWIWYNYWYVRGSYVYTVERPVKTDRRHYCEDWLSRKVNSYDEQYCDTERSMDDYPYPNTLRQCYGMCTEKYIGRWECQGQDISNLHLANIGSYFCPGQNKLLNIE